MPDTMTSIVKLRQTSTSELEVEHPPTWTAEQVQAAALVRMPDLLRSACSWEAANGAVITEVRLDEELPEDESSDPWMSSPERDIVLTEDDLP